MPDPSSPQEAGRRASRRGLEWRWALAALCYTLAPLCLLLLPGHVRAIAPAWDAGMAFGVLAAGGTAALPLLSARWWSAQVADVPFLRLIHDVHLGLGCVIAAFAGLHVLVLWALEPRVVEYLKPTARAPMLAGLLALVLLLLLCVTSLWRLRLAWRYRSWRRWHAVFSVAALAGIAWHVLDAHYYFRGSVLAGALLWLLAVPTVLSAWLRRHALPHGPGPVRLDGGQRRPLRGRPTVVLITAVWLGAVLCWLLLGAYPEALTDESPCAVEPCL